VLSTSLPRLSQRRGKGHDHAVAGSGAYVMCDDVIKWSALPTGLLRGDAPR
jgi:hypothetical protein